MPSTLSPRPSLVTVPVRIWWPIVISATSRTEGLVAGREASELLQGALQKLSPELRETVILRDLEELEYREIAQVLHVPEGTVKSRLNRGRAELARVLRRQKVAV